MQRSRGFALAFGAVVRLIGGAGVCGARVCGARVRGARVRGARVCGARVCGARMCATRVCAKRVCTFGFRACLSSALVVTTAANAQVAGEIRGRVTDVATLQPIPNAVVVISGQAGIFRVLPDGTYVIRGVASAVYAITVRAVGYEAQQSEVSITNGRIAVAHFELRALATELEGVLVQDTANVLAPGVVRYSRADIERLGRRDVAEMLRGTPGVTIAETGGPGQPSQISIRGSSANQVLVLLDGVPQNSELTGVTDLSRIALENVEAIIVRTGAQSARYGPRAMGGVIEVTSRRVQRDLSVFLRAGTQGEYHGSVVGQRTANLRTVATGASLTADVQSIRGDFAYTVPDVRGGGTARRRNAGSTTSQLQSALVFGDDQSGAALRVAWQHGSRGMAGTIVQPSASGRQQHDRWSTAVNAQGHGNVVAWNASADVSREAGVFADDAPPFGQPFNDTLHTTATTGALSLAYVHDAVQLLAGADARGINIWSTTLASAAPRWQRQLGAWTSARTRYQFRHANFAVGGEITARVDHNSLSGDQEISPRASVQVTNNRVAASLSLGSGYAPATISDQYFHEGVQTRANPALRSERTRRDLEARLTLHESTLGAVSISGEVSAYRADVDGMIFWLPDFRYVWSPTNYDVTRRGWDLSALSRVPTLRVGLQGVVSRSDVAYAGGVLTGQVAYRPRTTANVDLMFDASPVHASLNGRYAGARRTVAGSALNALAPYWLFDLRTSTSIARHGLSLSPTFSIENLLNRSAALLADYPLPSRRWSVSLRVRQSGSR